MASKRKQKKLKVVDEVEVEYEEEVDTESYTVVEKEQFIEGCEYKIGDVIELTPERAQELIAMGCCLEAVGG